MFRNISLFFVLLAIGVWALSVVKAPEAEPTPLETPELALEEIELLEQEIEDLIEEVLSEEEAEEEVETEEEPAQLSLERDAADPTVVLGEGFSLLVPEDWLVLSASERSTRSSRGRYSHGWIKNLDAQEAYGHPTEVSVHVEDYEKGDEWTLDSVVDRWAMDEDGARFGVQVYLFGGGGELSEADQSEIDAYMDAHITVELESVQIDGREAYMNTFVCEQACYIEGSPPAMIAYYIDAGDRVWVITGRTAYSDQADELLAQAQEVMDSFELN